MAEPGDGSVLELRDYLHALWNRKWVVLVATLVMTIAAYGVSVTQDPVYEATAQFRVQSSVNPAFEESGNRSEESVQSEVQVLQSAPVVERVRDKLGGRAPAISAETVSGTEFIRVTAESGDPESAAAIANAFVQSYVEYRRQQTIDQLTPVRDQAQARYDAIQAEIDDLTAQLSDVSEVTQPATYNDLADRRTAAQSRLSTVRASLDEYEASINLVTGVATDGTPATPPDRPSKPQPVRNGLLAIPVGLVFGMGLVFLFEYLDDSIKSKADLERATGVTVPILGLIPAVPVRDRGQGRLATMEDPTSAASEAYRSLRTSVQFLGLDEPLSSLQVTSASASEGKTTTVSNLALVLARGGERKVVVVDCDLRRPRLHEFFGLSNNVGFTSVLLGEVPLSAAVQPFPGAQGLSVLVSGPIPSDPSELLASRRTAEVLASLRADGALILLDTPPVLPVTDALVVSKWVDATLLVTLSGFTMPKQVQRALELLSQVDAPVVGSVLNRVPIGRSGYAYGYGASDYQPKQTQPQRKQVTLSTKAPAGR